jgi:RNA polymerase sigma-70 factor (ECF subfamily)
MAESAVGVQAVDHLPRLRRRSLALTRNRADAEDLVQDAYVRALRGADRFEPGTNLGAWLLTILRNLTLNHRRDTRRWHTAFERADTAVELAAAAPRADSPDARILDEVVSPDLQAALESLPKALRDAVWLRDVEDMTYREMAEQLRIPIGTVMSRIARGRRQLHIRLAGKARQNDSSTSRKARA